MQDSEKESSRKYIEFFNIEIDEELKIQLLIVPSPILSPILSPVSSSISNTVIRTPEIDPIQQEIYDYIEPLEKNAKKRASATSNQEKRI